MRSRVMPGSFVTIERRVPVRRLNSVDLPTLGRPTITSDGSFCAMIYPRTHRSKQRLYWNLPVYRDRAGCVEDRGESVAGHQFEFFISRHKRSEISNSPATDD